MNSGIRDTKSDVIRVLLSDDHAVMREGLRMILEAQGNIEVVGDAGDGREAVRVAQQLSPDIVVMDIAMEGLNGIDATRQIRERCPSTQVVILSMYATSEYVYRALEAGALGYVLKETAGGELVKAIRAAHLGRRYLSPSMTEALISHSLSMRQTPHDKSPLDRLSTREREVLQLVVEGKTSAQIAEVVNLSPKTVETYRSRMKKKLDLDNLPDLVKFAIEHGLTRLK